MVEPTASAGQRRADSNFRAPPQPKQIVAYAVPLSVAPGEVLRVMASCESGDAGAVPPSFQAQLVRLICGDDRKRGAGYREESIASSLDGDYPARKQSIRPGSYVTLEGLPGFAALAFSCAVMPTTPRRDRQTILSGPGATALVIEDGRLTWRCDGSSLQLPNPVVAHRWHRVAVRCDGRTTALHCAVQGLTAAEPRSRTCRARAAFGGAVPPGDWQLAAADGLAGFNGRIEAPRFEEGGNAVAAWDFGRDMASAEILDTVQGLRGVVHQHPARAVKGARWDGSVQRWLDAPDQYAAIHFHEDDLTDAGWAPDIEWRVPHDLPSGVYAVRLTTENSEDHAVFFVRPRATAGSAKTPGGGAGSSMAERKPVLFLAATGTYLAYANQRRALDRNRNPSDAYFLAHPEVGKSLYEYHVDGSGVMYSSFRRPVLNLKPRTLTWGFNADTSITAWLHRSGVRYDVATDHDLHRDGARLLEGYRCVITGTHPEYHSTEMLDGLQGFLTGGGRLMYMGGNGFYWRIAFDPADPAVIEVRRAEDGTRTWIAEPGEYYHAFTGEYGGLWRRLGRPPNHLVGVGFAAQGFEGGTCYRLQPAANDARTAFIMAGVGAPNGIVGDHGSQAGGAAGEEIDRWDPALGSPAHALVLASSEHSPRRTRMTVDEGDGSANAMGAIGGMLRTKEEFHETQPPDPDDPNVRADMVFFETPAGGAVFASSSISFAGALATDDYDNDIARIAANVLARFTDPTAFEYPR